MKTPASLFDMVKQKKPVFEYYCPYCDIEFNVSGKHICIECGTSEIARQNKKCVNQ